MFWRNSRLALYLGIALGVALVPRPALAANVTLQGTIGTDDAIQLFNVSIATAGLVDIRSYGYAGGTTSAGTVAPRGGFDTILTLFDVAGAFLTDNDEGAGGVDPVTGLAADARITTNLTAGNYILALTQFDNFALGFSLSDGFVQTGNPNFTADPTFTTGGPCASGMFRDISGTEGHCRNGNWTVDFVNVASVTPVPEPSALLLTGLGLGVLVLARRGYTRSGAQRLLGTVVLGLSAVSVQAQQSTDPDYSKVSDFLNGQRTLLQVTDLQILSYDPYFGFLYFTPVTTSNSQQTNQDPFSYGQVVLDGFHYFSARMFNQPQAGTIAACHVTGGSNLLVLAQNAISGDYAQYSLGPGNDAPIASGTVADFTLDGYDDLAFSLEDGRFVVMSPNNVNDPKADFRRSSANLDVLKDMTTGDFNGDGKREIAGLTVLPSGGLKLVIYTVDPTTLAIASASSFVLTTPGANAGSPITHASIATGRFNTAAHDRLAVAFATDAGQAYVEIIDFDLNTLNPHESPQMSPSPGVAISSGFIQIETGKFGLPNNPYDQIAYLSASSVSSNGKFFEILSVNPTNLQIKGNAPSSYASPCAYGIAVGNFDNRQLDPLNPGQTQYNPSAQVAFVYGGCGFAQDKAMNIYSADPNTFALTSVSGNALPDLGLSVAIGSPQIFLVATDTQGRSLTLGEPTVITINDATQPSVVVGTPPMHVDFVSPDPLNKVPPQVLNLSAVPEGFKTTYDQETSSSVKTSTANKTSWSFGAKESGTASLTIGDPDTSGLKISDTITAAQKLKGSSETVHGSYTSKTFDLSATTGFGDEVSYVQRDLKIWVYPVIGKMVCPTATPNCSNPVPLTIQFSAPVGDPTPQASQGQSVSWYQPPWEPGNILSYPANLQQLQSIYPDLSQLTNGLQFLTDTSTITQKTTWSVTTDDTTNTSFNQNYSFENDFSVSGSVGFLDITAGGSYSIDLSGSYGLSTVTNNTTTLGSSTGVQVTKPGTFPLFQNYGYFVNPYIMGTTVPGGVVDNQQLSTDVQTFGLLRAMFTVDPLASGAGGWWQQAYSQAPDVALNHPSRWYISTPGLTNPIPPYCLATGTGSSQMDCAELNARSPNNPWLSPYHQMRGLFISNAASPGQGPQLETANAGDVLTLQARVYNYSLKAMPAGTEVHVRFYFTPWNETIAAGDGTLINEVALPPIPPFSNLTSAPPNWVLASTTFDTSKFPYTKNGNVSVAFWVVVWMQTPGPGGQLIPEMPGHGLTAIPGTLKSLVDVPEECQPGGSCYSNNAGFYKQAFYICSATDQNACGGALSVAPGPLSGTAAVNISKVEISAKEITPRDTVVLSATLLATGGHASVSANFYDGDPKHGGRLIGVERIPHITQNDPYQIQTLYRTNTCGVHHLFVVVNKGKPSEVVRRAPPLRVACTASR